MASRRSRILFTQNHHSTTGIYRQHVVGYPLDLNAPGPSNSCQPGTLCRVGVTSISAWMKRRTMESSDRVIEQTRASRPQLLGSGSTAVPLRSHSSTHSLDVLWQDIVMMYHLTKPGVRLLTRICDQRGSVIQKNYS
jgi:hypothetical protein